MNVNGHPNDTKDGGWFALVLMAVFLWPVGAGAQPCPRGFYDPRNGGECWECPSGFNRTIAPVTATNACEVVRPATFSPASRQGPEGCGNDILDPRNGGECWRCPAGLVRTWSPVNGPSACGLPGGIADRKQAATFIKRAGCNAGDFPDLGFCWRCPGGSVRGTAHIESPQACVVPARTEAQPATLIGRPACGRLDERACALVGRLSCDAGLVEFDNICRTRGDCGTVGKRRCLAGEPGTWAPLTGCAATLVPENNICTSPDCGRLDLKACAIAGRSSCDPGLVEFDNMCRTRGACGTAGQRPCLIGESRPGCRRGLPERGGLCHACGALGQPACAVAGRKSCDPGLVEVNDLCFTRAACGSAEQRVCLIGERRRDGCDRGLFASGGLCLKCGAAGERACAIAGRASCDGGLVEFKDLCFPKGQCGAARQRVCLVGESARAGCTTGLTAQDGVCVTSVAVPPPPPGPLFAFVRTNPPAPALTTGTPVTIIASAFNGTTKRPVTADTIEILQADYAGPGSSAPAPVTSCTRVNECRFTLPRSSSRSVSYSARVVRGNDSFTSPIRVTDITFTVSPVRMNVSAEEVGGTIALVPFKRAVDIIFFAGSGYERSTSTGTQAFFDRLSDELATMLGVSSMLSQRSSLADNLGAVSFYASPVPSVVKRGDGLIGMCEHSTSGPVAWGDAQGILHAMIDCRDWSVPGPFYSAKDAQTSWHEMHHAAFQMSDEYCVGTVHSQRGKFPNVYNSQAECAAKSSNAATCTRIVCAGPPMCTSPCSTAYWRSDPENDVMNIAKSVEQPDDLRATSGKFDECKAGGC